MHTCAYFLFSLIYYQCKAIALPGIRIAKQSKQVQKNTTRLYQVAILFLYTRFFGLSDIISNQISYMFFIDCLVYQAQKGVTKTLPL